jgi:hypothetical protein
MAEGVRMKTRRTLFSRSALPVSFLTGLALAVYGCSDADHQDEGGGAGSGAGGFNSGGAGTAGTSNGGTQSAGSGGTSSGGTDNGGTSSGGTDSGGTDNGGTDNGGTDNGGTDNGGTDNGGAGGGDGPYVPPVPSLPAPVGYVAGGSFAPLGAYENVTGKALIVRLANGTTVVQLQAEGLTADTQYPAHVHALPCGVDNGGGHYMIDPALTPSTAANEIHVGFTTDQSGIGRASVSVNHAARPDAQSIVIHDPAASNTKMACVDLKPAPLVEVTATGSFAPFASATELDRNIAGTATMTRTGSGSRVEVSVTGLDEGETYMAHVHALPCALNDAGGHYKIDPTVATAEAGNELWPALVADETTMLESTHLARPDAQSIVIHRAVSGGGSAPKVACADLVRVEPYGDYVTSGDGVLLSAGTSRFPDATASAAMTRKLPSTTSVTLTVAGLGPSATYPVHVHEYSCGTANGGAHYMLDATGSTGQANEIWLPIDADWAGHGQSSVSVTTHLARPEAGSIVIHDPSDNARLICIDLN